MNKKEQNKYASETIKELRWIAAEAQSRGDKAGAAAAEYRIQRILEGWG